MFFTLIVVLGFFLTQFELMWFFIFDLTPMLVSKKCIWQVRFQGDQDAPWQLFWDNSTCVRANFWACVIFAYHDWSKT